MKKLYYLEVNGKTISPSYESYNDALFYGYEIQGKVKGQLSIISTDGFKHTIEKIWEKMD